MVVFYADPCIRKSLLSAKEVVEYEDLLDQWEPKAKQNYGDLLYMGLVWYPRLIIYSDGTVYWGGYWWATLDDLSYALNLSEQEEKELTEAFKAGDEKKALEVLAKYFDAPEDVKFDRDRDGGEIVSIEYPVLWYIVERTRGKWEMEGFGPEGKDAEKIWEEARNSFR